MSESRERSLSSLFRLVRKPTTAITVVGLLVAMAGAAIAASMATKPVREARSFVMSMVPDSRVRLLKVGGSTVNAHCDDSDGVQIGVTGGPDSVDYISFLGRQDPTSDVRFQHLPPGGSELLVAAGDDSATLTHFAIFDGSGTSASGTAAIFADAAKQRCLVTLQAAG